jgi:hypothetical protein
MLGEMGEKGNNQVYENDIVRMYLSNDRLYTEDYVDVISDESDEQLFEDEIEVKEIVYDKKYSQEEVCEDSKKEVFDMEKNVDGFYKHLDTGGFF